VRCRSCKLCFTLKIQKAQIQPPCHIWHPSPPPKVACIDVREISHALVSVKCLMSVLCICDIPHSYVTWLICICNMIGQRWLEAQRGSSHTRWNTLQHTATPCIALQRTLTHRYNRWCILHRDSVGFEPEAGDAPQSLKACALTTWPLVYIRILPKGFHHMPSGQGVSLERQWGKQTYSGPAQG